MCTVSQDVCGKSPLRQRLATAASAALLSLLLHAPNSGAALTADGNGLVEDTVTGLIWLQNADLAATSRFGVSGIASGGAMSFAAALNWIAALNTANYLGHADWALPEIDELSTLYNVSLEDSYVQSGSRPANIGPFTNLQWSNVNWGYWSDSVYTSTPPRQWFLDPLGKLGDYPGAPLHTGFNGTNVSYSALPAGTARRHHVASG